jgi:hypothetical protein
LFSSNSFVKKTTPEAASWYYIFCKLCVFTGNNGRGNKKLNVAVKQFFIGTGVIGLWFIRLTFVFLTLILPLQVLARYVETSVSPMPVTKKPNRTETSRKCVAVFT